MAYIVNDASSSVVSNNTLIGKSSLTVDIPSVELVSQERTAPFSGPRSSEDYNASIRERMIDLAVLASTYNDYLRPILLSLSASALLPEESPIGLEGRTLFTDSSDKDSLFYDNADGRPLTVAESVRQLDSKIEAFRIMLDSIEATLGALQTRLSASGQVDVSKALQNLANSFVQLNTTQNTQGSQITQLINSSTVTTAAKKVPTPALDPSSVLAVQVLWDTPFPDNAYVVACDIQDDTGVLKIQNFSYLPSGVGIEVRVANDDPNNSVAGNITASALQPH